MMSVNRRRVMGKTFKILPYLKFTALEDGTFKHNTDALEYSLDEGRTWVALSANTDTPIIHTGESICWRGTINPSRAQRSFSSTGYFDASGDPRSIIYSSYFSDKPLKNFCFNGLFKGCDKLVNAKDILLPTLALANRNEYYRMFENCTSLVSAPALPATTLTNSCYFYMFSGCTSLVTAPVLNATSLAQLCYSNMFRDCSSLINVQTTLPATTLVESCYQNMFYNCTSLTTAPTLPATTLEKGCYRSMFSGCTSLVTAPVLNATSLAQLCYSNMFRDCSSLINVQASLPATTLAELCYINMFYNCTSLTTAPVLPATTLETACYRGMFSGCTSLTTAPVLPATTLCDQCYFGLFMNCSNLSYVKALFVDITGTNPLYSWVQRVASNGTFVKASGATIPSGANGIPKNWTVEEV